MNIISILGTFPQVWLAYKESNLTDLSLGTWLISTTEGLIWLTYSLFQKDISITVFAFFQAITSSLIVAFKLAHQAKIQRQIASIASPIGEIDSASLSDLGEDVFMQKEEDSNPSQKPLVLF